jgi:hypothetical protein
MVVKSCHWPQDQSGAKGAAKAGLCCLPDGSGRLEHVVQKQNPAFRDMFNPSATIDFVPSGRSGLKAG